MIHIALVPLKNIKTSEPMPKLSMLRVLEVVKRPKNSSVRKQMALIKPL